MSIILKGIDVSTHQGNVNWSVVKNHVDFAILRAGYGRLVSQQDAQFTNNYTGCKSNNIPCGAYWYSYAMNEDDAVLEAKAFLEVLKGKTFEYPVYFDIEEPKQLALGKTMCSKITKAFLDVVEKAGYFVGIYTSKSHLETHIDQELRNRYAVWVAHYVSKTTYSGQFGIWQYTSTGTVPGVNGRIDMNYCYVDYPTQIKSMGLNGFVKTVTPTPQPSTPNPTPTPQPTGDIKVGSLVSIDSNAVYYNGTGIPAWVKSQKWYVSQITGDRAVLGKSEDGKYNIQSPISTQFIKTSSTSNTKPVDPSFKSYTIQLDASSTIFTDGTGSNATGVIGGKGGVFTIVDEQTTNGVKYGKLKSGAGWVKVSHEPVKVDNTIRVGDTVRVLNAVQYNGKSFKVYVDKYKVLELKGDRAVISADGKNVTAAINTKNLQKV